MMNHDNRVQVTQPGNGNEVRLMVCLPSLEDASSGGDAGDEIGIFTVMEGYQFIGHLLY
jgi:hypothetical protein